MNEEFPDVIFAVRNQLGETFYFSDLKKCPIAYDEQIQICIYHRGGTRILKRIYEVFEISSSSNVDEVK